MPIIVTRNRTVIRARYCISLPGLLKWFEIIFASIVLGLILSKPIYPDHYYHVYVVDGEEFTCIVSVVCLVVNFVLLLIFFFSWHAAYTSECFVFASVYYGLSVLLWIIAGGVEIYATLYFRDRWGYDYHGHHDPFHDHYYHHESLYHQRAAAAAFCFFNALLFFVSLYEAKYNDL